MFISSLDEDHHLTTIIFARLVASDDDYALFSVVVFKRVHDEFVQKCRENKYGISNSIVCIWRIMFLQVYRSGLHLLGGAS